jgi:hypothetical protein
MEIINPQEVQKQRTRSLPKRMVINEIDPQDENKEDIVQEIKTEALTDSKKYISRAGTIDIHYETNNRFSIPSSLYFRDYTIEDVNNLTLSRQEDLLENLLVILNNAVNEDANCKIEDMLMEEFLETLVGIKMQFNIHLHQHPWVCDCQNGVTGKDQVVNQTEIDLKTIKYKSIEEADEYIRSMYKPTFEVMSKEDFKKYLVLKYGNDPMVDVDNWTIEQELEKIQVKEPIIIDGKDGKSYTFRFMRVKDVIEAQKKASQKYAGKIKQVNSKQPLHGMGLADQKALKEKEIEELQYQQAKDTILYARAFTLEAVDGRKLKEEEKFNIYKNIPRSVLFDFINFMDEIKFGIQDERDFTCPLCGTVKQRSLQLSINPYELLPLDLATKGKQRQFAGINVRFGV